jgi:hypothetical protein
VTRRDPSSGVGSKLALTIPVGFLPLNDSAFFSRNQSCTLTRKADYLLHFQPSQLWLDFHQSRAVARPIPAAGPSPLPSLEVLKAQY